MPLAIRIPLPFDPRSFAAVALSLVAWSTPAAAAISGWDIKPRSISIAAANVPAIEGGADQVFVVTLSQPSYIPVTVRYTLGGTASPGIDYTGPTLAVTIPAGSRTGTIVVHAISDGLTEVDETVVVTLAGYTSTSPIAPYSCGGTAVIHIKDAGYTTPTPPPQVPQGWDVTTHKKV